jgi:hypothetical protein
MGVGLHLLDTEGGGLTVELTVPVGVPVATLHRWRYLGTGPAAFRVGKHLRYDPDVVRRWLVDECTGAA